MSMPLPAPSAENEVDDPRRRTFILVAACTSLIAVVASVSGLNVAQADLAKELGASQTDLLWIINGYTIALAALLMPIGAIGDRWGRKKVLVTGLIVFTLANLSASMASGVNWLLVSRIVAGAAAAMIMPATLSVITSSFPAAERDRAIGIWAGFAGAGGILGLVGSAFVIDTFTWPWVFSIPVALAVAGLGLTLAYVPHSREHSDHPFDTVGSVLSALGLGAIVLGIHEGPERGWTSPLALIGLVLGVAALIAFCLWELRHPKPLLQLRLFRNRMLTSGTFSLLIVFSVLLALFLVLVQFLQAVLGYSALKAAMGLMPMAVFVMPLSAVSPRIAAKVGMRTMFVGGALFVAAGLLLMGAMASQSYVSIIPGLVLVSTGAGLLMTPGTTAITSGLPASEQGVASALNDTVRELGGALGVALIGSVLSATYSSKVSAVADTLPPEAAHYVKGGIGGAYVVSQYLGDAGQSLLATARSAFIDAWSTAMWISAGIAVAAAVFALVWTPSRGDEQRWIETTDEADETRVGA